MTTSSVTIRPGLQRCRDTLVHLAIAGRQDDDHLSEILLIPRTAQAAGPGAGEIAHLTTPAACSRSIAPAAVDPFSKKASPGAWARAYPALDRAREHPRPASPGKHATGTKARPDR